MNQLSKLFFICCFLIFGCGKPKNEQQILINSIEAVQQFNEVIEGELKWKFFEVRYEIEYTNNKEQKPHHLRLNFINDRMTSMDSMANKVINRIDTLKQNLLQHSNINRKAISDRWIYFSKIPENKLSIDVEDFFLDSKQLGKSIYNDLKRLRKELVQFAGTYERGGFSYSITPKEMNKFSDKEKFRKEVEQMVESNPINHKEEKQVIIDLYIKLSYAEKIDGASWEQFTFKDATLLYALAILSNLQNDIIQAKRLAMMNTWIMIGCNAGYPFNKVMPVATGPATVSTKDSFELKVAMVAFDSNNEPAVEITNSSSIVEYPGDGTGRIKLKLDKGIHTIRGTVSIKNKSGLAKTEKWKYTVNVLE